MIGKIARSGSSFFWVLTYCQYDRCCKHPLTLRERGELIYYQHVDALLFGKSVGLGAIAEEMHRVAALNRRTTKPVCHFSLSFPPGEHPPIGVVQRIIRDFARTFGFSENGLLAYRHTDTPHEHVHIVANKINASGKNTAHTHFNYLKMGQFCRHMEIRYGLRATPPMPVQGRKSTMQNEHLVALRTLIDHLIPECSTLPELRARLLQKGYKSQLGRGITFIDAATGVTIKGSALGRGYSRQHLGQRLSSCIRNIAPASKVKPEGVSELDRRPAGGEGIDRTESPRFRRRRR